ncbi:lamin tail domain-containing protein [Streptomyces venezuelae]|uniref:lamin tail domain-containing protein n=1 Tax=Streptomyces venezuelae TaxID=54571 RepID=UPI0037D26950
MLARYDFAIGGGGGTNQRPTASYTPSCTALSCTFTDGSTDSDGTVVSRSWNFGDGRTSTATNPTVTYASAGTYVVSLTVTDNGGATHTTTRNVTVGSGGGPANVSINEVLANEPGSSTAGEAVEIVNTGGTAISVDGWTLRNGTTVRHTFAAGTTLQPGKAITVFGAASAIPGGVAAVAASTGGLSLSNSGGQVLLRDAAGTTVQLMTYTSSQADADGVSLNRSPDGSASGGWAKHNTISSLTSLPGRHADGTPTDPRSTAQHVRHGVEVSGPREPSRPGRTGHEGPPAPVGVNGRTSPASWRR